MGSYCGKGHLGFQHTFAVSWAKLHEVRIKVSWACASSKVVHVCGLDLYDAWTDNLQGFPALDDE